jgi:hypothetical protein
VFSGVPSTIYPSPSRLSELSFHRLEPGILVPVERAMTKKDKIAFIRSSKRKTHVYNDLHRFTDVQLNELIREIVQGLVRESEIIANAYINGYR